jgi:hypothetical protein
MKLVRKNNTKKETKTQNKSTIKKKNTIQNRTDIQISIPQSPNTNTVHNTIIE